VPLIVHLLPEREPDVRVLQGLKTDVDGDSIASVPGDEPVFLVLLTNAVRDEGYEDVGTVLSPYLIDHAVGIGSVFRGDSRENSYESQVRKGREGLNPAGAVHQGRTTV